MKDKISRLANLVKKKELNEIPDVGNLRHLGSGKKFLVPAAKISKIVSDYKGRPYKTVTVEAQGSSQELSYTNNSLSPTITKNLLNHYRNGNEIYLEGKVDRFNSIQITNCGPIGSKDFFKQYKD